MSRHVYVHVPFCARRCSYCDFAIAVRRNVPVDDYVRALEAELRARFGDDPREPVDTIYFGGGTPSRLGGEGLARALAAVQRHFPASAGAEITVEANPDDVSPDAAAAWGDAGVTRLSLGSQSFDERALAWMHRTHDAAAIARAADVARRAGIAELSLDLIFALPEELGRDFSADVARVLALEPDHVSLYGLTVEPGTALGKWIARGTTAERPEEGYEADFRSAHDLLSTAGFEHYEVSNYARPGRRARHNSAYWTGAPYVGVGPSAHGYDGSVRRWNARNYADWLHRVDASGDPIEGSEELTRDNRVAEEVYLGLRTDGGLAVQERDRSLLERWERAGWIVVGPDGRARCTVDGWLRLDALAAALTHLRSR